MRHSKNPKILVTGSSGLIGSEVVQYFNALDWEVHGIDNNMRADFFGPDGDTSWNLHRLATECTRFTHYHLDIRDRKEVVRCLEGLLPDAVVHAAAQPSHDLAAKRPFDDFDVNAVGTMNLLEATRRYVPDAPFVFLSTNKVYGDAPNEIPLQEQEKRWDYARPEDYGGVREDMRIDASKHSLFGASKVAADIMVQEYGRYFGMKTCCLRGGCLTGPSHSGVELHGFLSYLVKVNLTGGCYRIFGYKGKQVRDNIHSYDVARLIEMIIESPRYGEVYNLGGGRANSCSILEAFDLIEGVTGRRMEHEYLDQPRSGDHICYISDLTKLRLHYPSWDITVDLPHVLEQLANTWAQRHVHRAHFDGSAP
jgi:CDP-paratose 2-epimerase